MAKRKKRPHSIICTTLLVRTLVDMFVEESKKDQHWLQHRYDFLRSVAERFGQGAAFDAEFKTRPKVREFNLVRITEERINLFAQNVEEAYKLGLDHNRFGGATVTIKQRRS